MYEGDTRASLDGDVVVIDPRDGSEDARHWVMFDLSESSSLGR